MNLLSYREMLSGSNLTDILISFGFPLKLYLASGFGGEWIVWTGLIEDIFIAFGGSAILGLLGRLAFKKLIVD